MNFEKKKKNGFFNFCFSFIPGVTEMYSGFMKNGLSLMLLFLFSICISVIFSGVDIFWIFPILAWFYAFFHARNLASSPAEMFPVLNDGWIWEEFISEENNTKMTLSFKKWFSVTLIVMGAFVLWNNLQDSIVSLIPESYWDQIYPLIDRCPQVLISILIIVLGIVMIAGKRRKDDGDNENN